MKHIKFWLTVIVMLLLTRPHRWQYEYRKLKTRMFKGYISQKTNFT